MIDVETMSMVGRNVEAVAVLEWAGYSNTPGTCLWENSDLDDMRCAKSDCSCAWSINANWIHGTLIPALEERLGLKAFIAVHHMDGFWVVELQLEHEATGPTFEAAFLAAAAKAVSE